MSHAAELVEHGGRLCVARALHPRAPEPWIDLSTGINPEAYPAPLASAAARARLPTPDEIRELEGTAGRAFGLEDEEAVAGSERVIAAERDAGAECIADAERMVSAERFADAEPNVSAERFADAEPIVGAARFAGVLRVAASERIAAAAGSEAVLRLMPFALRARAAVVAGPTYSSHAAAWRQAGVRVTELMPRVAKRVPVGAVVTLVNPNNPDGAVMSRERLLELHDDISSRDGYLVVDEAFADVEPGCSVAAFAGLARYPRLIVLRSFGKFYGLAGVRLGFVLAAPPVIARFRELLGDWAVSADAIAAGVAAYADYAWAGRTRERLLRSARRLDDLLKSSGFEIVGGTSLFRLARSHDAAARFEQLLRAGILARPFAHDPTLLRFGLPYEPTDWLRFADALRKP